MDSVGYGTILADSCVPKKIQSVCFRCVLKVFGHWWEEQERCLGGLSPAPAVLLLYAQTLSPGDPAIINMGRVTQAPQLESPFVVKRERKRVSRAGGPLAGSRRRLLSSCCLLSAALSGLRCGYEVRPAPLWRSKREKAGGWRESEAGEGGVRDARARVVYIAPNSPARVESKAI